MKETPGEERRRVAATTARFLDDLEKLRMLRTRLEMQIAEAVRLRARLGAAIGELRVSAETRMDLLEPLEELLDRSEADFRRALAKARLLKLER